MWKLGSLEAHALKCQAYVTAFALDLVISEIFAYFNIDICYQVAEHRFKSPYFANLEFYLPKKEQKQKHRYMVFIKLIDSS